MPSPTFPNSVTALYRFSRPQTAPNNQLFNESLPSHLISPRPIQDASTSIYPPGNQCSWHILITPICVRQADVDIHTHPAQLVKTVKFLPGRGMFLPRMIQYVPLFWRDLLIHSDGEIQNLYGPLWQGLFGCRVRLPGDLLDLAEAGDG